MSTTGSNADADFSLTATRKIVKDLFKPNPLIYWTDFVLTYGLGMFCFMKVRGGTLLTPHQGFTGTFSQAFFFVASCLLFYRAAMFIHEVVHHRNGELRAFRFVWNLTCGVPFLMPSFAYYTHIDHHRRRVYGTEHDGEYIDLVHRNPWYMVFYLSWSFIAAPLVVFRFLVLTPIAWTVPGARAFIHQRASSMVMDPTYIRPLPTQRTMRVIRWQELACFAWCMGIAIVPPVFLGRWPIPFLIHAYLVSVVIVLLNSIRTLGAHRFTNDGQEMTFVQQLVDSVNFPNSPATSELWAPVGCRFHALHHLFPSMPYHNLAKAHRRLMDELPADSAYRLTVADSLPGVLRTLWQAASETSASHLPSKERRIHESTRRKLSVAE